MNRYLSLAICLAAVATAGAQKANVEQAARLAGKTDQLNQARSLIKQAMENPETQNDAKTYYIAGKIELDAYDNAFKTSMIKPDDPTAQPKLMADELMNAYKYFMKALPLDSTPDAKGQVKPKFSKDIINRLGGHANDFFTAGANYFNEKMYYPEAYEAFIVYGNLPTSGILGKMSNIVPADQVATAFFNAGLAAYSGDQLEKSAEAFQAARNNGSEDPNAYIYEIACWQSLAQRDENRMSEAQNHIYNIASAGHAKFGLEQPLFLNNVINSLVIENKTAEAINALNEAIASNPEAASLYGLRGFVYDRAENDEASEADYRKAASMSNVDQETLINASKKIFRTGTKKWDAIEGVSAEADAARKNIKSNYFDVAKQMAEQAKAIDPSNPDLSSLLESIDYVLETYFSK